jgi:hypothetical protein
MVGIRKRDMLRKGGSSMNTRKRILLVGLITLGALIGVFLILVSSGDATVLGAVCGGFLGGLLYYVIQMFVSRRKRENVPYDHLDEQHPLHREIHKTYEAKFREMEDNVMADIMHFPPPKH